MNILAEDFTEKRIETLYRELRRERQLRKEAEANASRFHALLLAERIKHLPARPPR